MKRKILKLSFMLAAVLFTWLVGTGIMIWNFGKHDHARKSDCIIVLGAAAYGGKPSPVFEERIKHAVALFKKDEAPVIIFTGGWGDSATHAESTVGASFAISQGVNGSSILTETRSRTTHQNLAEAKILMDSAVLKSAIIVSDPLHLKRAFVMAGDLGIHAVTSPTPTSRYRSFRTKLVFLIREIYFYNHYVVTGH
jgi:uncharacterized SAM-binding protein YcdF (DUF218 family)